MSETKTAFAEQPIGSLKNVLYRYMEDHGYKYIHTLSQFITTLKFRENSLIDLILKKKVFAIVEICSRKPPMYTIEYAADDFISGIS